MLIIIMAQMRGVVYDAVNTKVDTLLYPSSIIICREYHNVQGDTVM